MTDAIHVDQCTPLHAQSCLGAFLCIILLPYWYHTISLVPRPPREQIGIFSRGGLGTRLPYHTGIEHQCGRSYPAYNLHAHAACRACEKSVHAHSEDMATQETVAQGEEQGVQGEEEGVQGEEQGAAPAELTSVWNGLRLHVRKWLPREPR